MGEYTTSELMVSRAAKELKNGDVIELDVAWRPLGAALHIGVRRSPLRTPSDVVALARHAATTWVSIASTPGSVS